MQPRRVARWGLIAYVFLVGLVALRPTPVDRSGGELLKVGRRFWRVGTAAGLLLSSLIELAQFLLLPARYPTLADVAANTLGATLGGLLALLIIARRKAVRIPPPARTL